MIVSTGYVLSYRTLYRLACSTVSPEKARDSLSSASFRRFFRLFPPVILSILFSHVLLLSGSFQIAHDEEVVRTGRWLEGSTLRWTHPTWISQTVEAFKNAVSRSKRFSASSMKTIVILKLTSSLLLSTPKDRHLDPG